MLKVSLPGNVQDSILDEIVKDHASAPLRANLRRAILMALNSPHLEVEDKEAEAHRFTLDMIEAEMDEAEATIDESGFSVTGKELDEGSYLATFYVSVDGATPKGKEIEETKARLQDVFGETDFVVQEITWLKDNLEFCVDATYAGDGRNNDGDDTEDEQTEEVV